MARSTRSKGDGSIYQRADGRWVGSIEAGWTSTGRKRRTVSGKTRAAVVAKLRKLRDEMDAGIVAHDATLTDWMTHWLDDICPERGLKPSTLYGYRSYIDRWIVPTIGHVRLKGLTADHVRKLHRAMRDGGKSAASIRQAHAILSRALKVAEREDRVRRNVAALVDVPSGADSHHGELTTEQAKRVLRSAVDDPRTLARLTCALVLGIRQGEALALQWPAVDLAAGLMEITEGLTIIRGEGPRLTGVKSVASNRVIPLPPAVVAILEAWQRHATDPLWVFPALRTGAGPERDPKRDWQVWRDALVRAGVPHVPLHGARASAASLLMEMGVPDRVIADILGHAQVATTTRHYLRSSAAGRADAIGKAAAELLG